MSLWPAKPPRPCGGDFLYFLGLLAPMLSGLALLVSVCGGRSCDRDLSRESAVPTITWKPCAALPFPAGRDAAAKVTHAPWLFPGPLVSCICV